MRKSLLGLFLLLAIAVTAGQRTPEQAAEIAAGFSNQRPQLRRASGIPRKATDMRLVHKAMQNNRQDAAFYVFNQDDNSGFVIVSADDRTAEDVLAYTEKGSFDITTANPNLQWWLSRYQDEITALQDMEETESTMAEQDSVTPIPNLLVNKYGVEITWYQGTPYNNLCPIDQMDNTRSLTGCVATATSMIMYKWRWPEKGTGSFSYTWSNCLKMDSWYNCTKSRDTVLSADFANTTYDWDNMMPAYIGKTRTAKQKEAVATLMYHCGVATEMRYGGDTYGGSGTYTDYMAYALKKFFGYRYNKFITMYSKAQYGGVHSGVTAAYNVSRDRFKEYFNADLEAGRPILMGGDSQASGGHAFVCCGRDAANRFYINWGWEGDSNGYYAITALKPGQDNFSNNLDAIIGIEPNWPEAVENTEVHQKARKILRDGQVVIIREDGQYNVLGQKINK